MTDEQIKQAAINALGDGKEAASVLYLLERTLSAGETVNVPGQVIQAKGAARLVFADSRPGANWSHECAYILIPEDGSGPEVINGTLPPDMQTYHVIYKGPKVEDWMTMNGK